MTDTAYVTRDELRAEMAEFRSEMHERFTHIERRFDHLDTQFVQLELRLTRQLGLFAFVGGLAGGLIAAAAKIFGN